MRYTYLKVDDLIDVEVFNLRKQMLLLVKRSKKEASISVSFGIFS
jgi:hypothetical protein